MAEKKRRRTVVDFVREYPGREAGELKALGWNAGAHGRLLEAERAGLVVCRDFRWYPKEEAR